MANTKGVGFLPKQTAFSERHEAFFESFPRLNAAIDAAFDRTITGNGPLHPAVFYLGIRTVDDFLAILVLCANDLALPAQGLIRSMYERVVTAAHLHANPDDAGDFAEFEVIERRRAAQQLKEAIGIPPELEASFQQIEEEYQRVKSRFETNLGRIRQRWSKTSFVELAKNQERLAELLVYAYYVPLQQAHSTLRSATAVLHEADGTFALRTDFTELSDEVFRLAYLLLIHALAIQAQHFAEPAIEAAVERAADDYLTIYSAKDAASDRSGA
jgi:hypothetical protein